MESKRKRRGKFAHDRTMELSRTASTLAAQMQSEQALSHCLVVLRGLDVGSVIRLERTEMVVGRDPECDIIITDEGVSRHHARFLLQGAYFMIEDLASTNGIFVNGTQVDKSILAEGDKVLLGRFTVLKYTQQDELELEYQLRIHESASLDALTGALNRRSLENRLASEWGFAKRHTTDLSVVMMDIDHFKKINDSYGHATGDEVLRTLAHHVRKAIRVEDLFGRYGGEEFVVLVRGVGHQGAVLLAERLRMLIERLDLRHSGTLVPVTSSFGVASIRHDEIESAEELLNRADKCLYKAKGAGRNKVVAVE